MSQLPAFNRFLGTRFAGFDEGEVRMELDLEPHHTNQRGVAHGGVVLSLLDSALGGAVVAAIPKEWWCATTSLTVQFLRGAEGKLTARGRVRRRASRVAFAEGELLDGDGNIVATAVGTWHLWPAKPGLPGRPAPGAVRVEPDGETVRVGKIVAVGRNYAEHRKEMGAPAAGPPVLFLKPASALFHPGEALELPRERGSVHHEVELVVLIGSEAKELAVEQALDAVRGFAVGLDLTLRDEQSAAKRAGTPWSAAKGFDRSAPVSSFVPREQVGDGSGLNLRLSVNGELRQQASTSEMQRSVAELVHFASRQFTLQPGDLLFTGTPAGVGPVQPGDRLTAEVDRVGSLELEFS